MGYKSPLCQRPEMLGFEAESEGPAIFVAANGGYIMRIDPFGLECLLWGLLLAALSGIGLELMFVF